MILQIGTACLTDKERAGLVQYIHDPVDLSKLSVDEFWDVRRRVAANKFTRTKTLVRLTKDKNVFVSEQAKKSLAAREKEKAKENH